MLALVFTAPNTVELQEVPTPEPAAGEQLIRVDAVGICGSELHGIRSTDFRTPPLVMGHEFGGTTADGRRVTVNPLLSCGECDLCRRGLAHLCRERGIIGIARPGAFAEYVSVPESAIHELPDGMSFETAAMIEPLANAVHAVGLAAPEPGCRIAVLGAGTIGLVTLSVARRHTDQVVVADLSADRLRLAERLGASAVTDELAGEFDVIIDAVGAAATHEASVRHLRRGGRAVWLGLLSSDPGFDGQQIVRDEKLVTGSYCYTPDDFTASIELAATADLDWTTSFPLTLGDKIFTELAGGRQDVVKALLRP